MHRSFDVMMWLDSRKCLNRDLPKETYDSVIMNAELEKEFDNFKGTIRETYYIGENDCFITG